MVPPQPSETLPQPPAQACAAASGVQQPCVLGLQTVPAAQVPQVMVPPQTSFTVPQVALDCWQRLESSSTSLQVPATQV
jgi:hypothetical protein